MVLKTKKNPIELRDDVITPAGTTIYGLHALEKGAFNASIIDAIESATKRVTAVTSYRQRGSGAPQRFLKI